jgi:hypothetical protein
LKVRSKNENAHPFPEGDHRANHVLAAPEDCEQSMLGPEEYCRDGSRPNSPP